MVRYTDDFMVLCESKEEARRTLSPVTEGRSKSAGTYNTASREDEVKEHPGRCGLLGFTVFIGHKMPMKEVVVRRYKDDFGRITRRNLPINLEMVIQRLA
jgi:hypothetical protein